MKKSAINDISYSRLNLPFMHSERGMCLHGPTAAHLQLLPLAVIPSPAVSNQRMCQVERVDGAVEEGEERQHEAI